MGIYIYIHFSCKDGSYSSKDKSSITISNNNVSYFMTWQCVKLIIICSGAAARYRTFGMDQWRLMHSKLISWRNNITSIHNSLKSLTVSTWPYPPGVFCYSIYSYINFIILVFVKVMHKLWARNKETVRYSWIR